ncbi:putative phospholipase B-like 2 isoform X1 [Stylophora pistillata]|uniref:putative phospholipase B-like 2 isoform X1 n=1 Tax=Stylophora pistillata TaxID=50429 RepID=UPI000C05483B|nr:putative phospholipase B-like 2 isoform X1 [Stylophora pistillata]
MKKVISSLLLLLVYAAYGDDEIYSATLENGGYSSKFLIQKGNYDDPVARGKLSGSIQKSGWEFFQVVTSGDYQDNQQAFVVGMLEGHMTSHLIDMHWQNTLADYCTEDPDFCFSLGQFLGENLSWMKFQIQNNPTDEYWHQVELVLEQLEGLKEGYKEKKSKAEGAVIPDFGFLLMQVAGDLDGLEQAFGRKTQSKSFGSGSCSALVKLLPGNKDLLISHDTWGPYNTMLRLFKFYDFPFHRQSITGANLPAVVPGVKQCFSSYPGRLLSGDDFYMINSGLLVQETTIDNDNPALWKYVQPVGTVLEWIRNLVANRLATTAREWVEIFSKYNSGTYNNQWMVVNYKQFVPNEPLVPDTFWILEQLPGTVIMSDMSEFLEKERYWASYNLPYFPKIYNLSGQPENVKKYGPWFDYHLNPRAQIFKRDQGKVNDLISFIKLMRYNNYKDDPLSKCSCSPPYSAENAISARSDLNPANGSYPFGFLGHRNHGGTDCKVTSYELFNKTLSCMAVSGPTHDQQPIFKWSTSGWKRPMGHPDAWNFEPIMVNFSAF